MNYEKVKHLEMIQGIIARMAQNGFMLKGWSVTLISALIAAGMASGSTGMLWLALFPAIAFWILDGYYLAQERIFRDLYDDMRLRTDSVGDDAYAMKRELGAESTKSWVSAVFSTTVGGFHASVVILLISWALIIST